MSPVRIALVDATGGRRLSVALPDDVPLEQLVPALARKLKLPEGDYTLTVEGSQAPLQEEATLTGSGVGDGATLRLERAVPEASRVEDEAPAAAEARLVEPDPRPSAQKAPSDFALRPPEPPGPAERPRQAGMPRWAWAVAAGLALVAVVAGMWLLTDKPDRSLRILETGGNVPPQGLEVAFSPDGSTLAVGAWPMVLWDVQTGRPLWEMVHEDDCLNSLAFSPDGMAVASGGCNSDAHVYDVQRGTHLRTLVWRGHENPYHADLYENHYYASVAFSPDGTTLASGMADGTVILWDARTGQQLGTLVKGDPDHGSSGCLMLVAFSPDGMVLASTLKPDGESILMLVLTDVETGEQLHAFEAGYYPEDLDFSPDGRTLAVALWDHVQLWDTQTGGLLHTLSLRQGAEALSLAFSPNGSTLATGWADGWVILWDADTGQTLDTLGCHNDRVSSVAYSPDGNLLASGSAEGMAILWDVAR